MALSTPASNPEARRYRDAVKAMGILEGAGHLARLAGGCVRDRILGIEPADYDVATDAVPATVVRLFAAAGVRTVPTGIDHGTVTVLMPAGPIEVTTLRIDVATDGRHAEVRFGTSFEEDAERRDFTINAMFEDRAGVVYDYFQGRDDLAAGVLRFVGDATLRIREDFLRIMRFFRFQARFGYKPADGTLEAIAAEREGLTRISQERITSELTKTLIAGDASAALAAMAGTGVLAIVLPEAAAVPLPSPAAFAAMRQAFAGAPPPVAGLAVMVLTGARPGAKALSDMGARLRLSRADIQRLTLARAALETLPALGHEVADALDFVDECEKAAGSGGFTDFIVPLATALAGALASHEGAAILAALRKVADIELAHGHRRIAKPPLDGRELAEALGIAAGPELGRRVEALKRAWRNGAFTTKDEALAWSKAQPA